MRRLFTGALLAGALALGCAPAPASSSTPIRLAKELETVGRGQGDLAPKAPGTTGGGNVQGQPAQPEQPPQPEPPKPPAPPPAP